MLDGNPWFVAGDVCRALDIHVRRNGEVNTYQALHKLRDDEEATHPMGGHSGPRAVQNVKIISESGLYKLVMRSDKPQAREFQDWVTRVVLPAIRKDGAYIMGEEKVASGELSDDDPIVPRSRSF